jgi:hypothetical protein
VVIPAVDGDPLNHAPGRSWGCAGSDRGVIEALGAGAIEHGIGAG